MASMVTPKLHEAANDRIEGASGQNRVHQNCGLRHVTDEIAGLGLFRFDRVGDRLGNNGGVRQRLRGVMATHIRF